MTHRLLILVTIVALCPTVQAQTQAQSDAAAVEEETLRHFQAL